VTENDLLSAMQASLKGKEWTELISDIFSFFLATIVGLCGWMKKENNYLSSSSTRRCFSTDYRSNKVIKKVCTNASLTRSLEHRLAWRISATAVATLRIDSGERTFSSIDGRITLGQSGDLPLLFSGCQKKCSLDLIPMRRTRMNGLTVFSHRSSNKEIDNEDERRILHSDSHHYFPSCLFLFFISPPKKTTRRGKTVSVYYVFFLLDEEDDNFFPRHSIQKNDDGRTERRSCFLFSNGII
jgi:hypothetical protein